MDISDDTIEAVDDNVQVPEDTPATIRVLDNDRGPAGSIRYPNDTMHNGPPWSITSFTPSGHGAVELDPYGVPRYTSDWGRIAPRHGTSTQERGWSSTTPRS